MEKVDLLIGEEYPIPPGGERGFVHGSYFGYWSEIDIVFELDGYSSIGFRAPFEHTRKEFREMFRPFSFKPVEVMVGNLETIFKGTLLDIDPDLSSDGRTVVVTANALPSVLVDCDMPASALPFEFKKVGLRSVFERCASPFGLKLDFQAEEGKPFDKIKIETNNKVQDFLAELTKQRNAVISNTLDGKLLCWQSLKSGKSICDFVEGRAPLSKVVPKFNPRECFSEVTGFASKKRGKKASKDTQKNPWLAKPLRPHTFKLEDTERGDAPEATKAFMGRMFGNMAAWRIENIPSWRDPQGDIWQPNKFISLHAPSAFVYRRSDLLIRRVELHQDKDNESATLEVVLPGAFNGEVPLLLPWDEPNAVVETILELFR
jgi:prophage tail gpP-like protein